MSRIFKELIVSNNKRIATPIGKWRRDMDRQYIKVETFK